jgi:hypothetical protein
MQGYANDANDYHMIWQNNQTTTSSAAPGTPIAFPVTPDGITTESAFATTGVSGSQQSKTNYRRLYSYIDEGIPAGTYSLASIIQELVNRSHRHKTHGTQGSYITNCNCDCDCSTCFVAGSLVLMADYTLKPIEMIEAGEKIIGINGTINTVKFRDETILGNKRSMMTFKDRSLYWTGEHPLWIKTLEGEEYFGVYDYNQYEREHNMELINPHTGEKIIHQGLTKKKPIIITKPVFFSTIIGWKLDDAFIDRSFPDNTKIYSLYTDGSHTMYVNGYLVSAFATDVDFEY